MKGRNVGRFLGGQFSFFLSSLLFTTIFLWSWEKNPLLTYCQHKIMNEHSKSQIAEGRIEENRLEISDSFVKNVTVSPSTRRKLMNSCNFARGRWIAERRRPLYSGFKCKLTQRTDFSYEGYRWQPENYSLGRQQFQSLMCMATGDEDMPEVENVGWKYGLVKPRGAIRPDGWACRFPNTNTTILYYWSASLCGIEPFNVTDPATKKLAEIGNAKNFTVYSIARWLDSQITSRPQLKGFFGTISPRHFSNGDWNTGGRCDSTNPLTKGNEVQQEESSDPVIGDAVKGTKVKLLDITAISELRDEGHISHYSLKASEGI
ncbi:hypothetical protein R3W88_015735 [Solanum pinnatisectum]|uniref:Uncharacterized protein n=1 Tax=Solanum pinnatisectum TaxID=50273 RepID=A0AAV9KVE1_9SOLN|nr:hypothetical protein R3W88_015735 [Solanum pinnatisectum]